jgi:hypothetical protein
MYRLYNTGASTERWGTPAAIFLDVQISPSIKALNIVSVRKEAISLMRLVENSYSDNLCSRPECHVVSKPFSISKNTGAVDILLIFTVTWSASLIHWSVVLWSAGKPNWLAFSKFVASVYFSLPSSLYIYISSARTAQKTLSNSVFRCCVHIRCRGNAFTQTLPRNGPCNHVTICNVLHLYIVGQKWWNMYEKR